MVWQKEVGIYLSRLHNLLTYEYVQFNLICLLYSYQSCSASIPISGYQQANKKVRVKVELLSRGEIKGRIEIRGARRYLIMLTIE